MNATNRAALLGKIHKVLKKHYQPIEQAKRSVLEHLVYACCLENASFLAADEAFAKLQSLYFDWNEVRVTTVAELAEGPLASVHDKSGAAQRVKRALHSVFEAHYSFDIDAWAKLGLGKAIAELEKHAGIGPFQVDYLTQNAFGGHAIALGDGALDALYAVGAMVDADAVKRRVPGLERAIEKKKGPEFFSLLHQLGADLLASPQSNRIKSILLEIDSTAKERMGKRPLPPTPAKSTEPKTPPNSKPLPSTRPTPPPKSIVAASAAKQHAEARAEAQAQQASKAPAKPTGKESPKEVAKPTAKGAPTKPAETKPVEAKSPAKPAAKPPVTTKPPVAAKPPAKEPPAKESKSAEKPADKSKGAAPKPSPKAGDAKKPSGSKGLTKKKPK